MAKRESSQTSSQKLQLGYYRHKKGGIAKVIGEAIHSETGEVFVAYYHKGKESGKMELWVRPKAMFLELVEENGQKIPRFEFIGNQTEAKEKFLEQQ
jgi:hypothetical protein